MDAAALPAPRSFAATGVLHLHLELGWRDTVLVARSFTHGVWSGPTKYHPFPMEGFECDPKGFVLASRDGDSYLLTPPLGASPARPLRLSEGQASEYRRGELTLRAWVTREQQVQTLDWLWPVCAPFAFLLAWRMIDWFGIVFALVLMLIPKAHPPVVVAAPPDTTMRLVKVLPMLREVKPEPLPEKPRDRLKLLLAGKRSDEVFKDSAKRAAVAAAAKESKKAALKDLIVARGTLQLLAAFDARPGGQVQMIDMLGSLKGNGEAFGAGGLGLSATGLGGGGTGVGLGSLGTIGTFGHGSGSGRAINAAEDKARALARTSGQRCWSEDDDDAVVAISVSIAADGSVTPRTLSKNAPARVTSCLERELREWKLPATADGGHVTVRFLHQGR